MAGCLFQLVQQPNSSGIISRGRGMGMLLMLPVPSNFHLHFKVTHHRGCLLPYTHRHEGHLAQLQGRGRLCFSMHGHILWIPEAETRQVLDLHMTHCT